MRLSIITLLIACVSSVAFADEPTTTSPPPPQQERVTAIPCDLVMTMMIYLSDRGQVAAQMAQQLNNISKRCSAGQ